MLKKQGAKQRAKAAVPLGLIWWQGQKRHPLNARVGEAVRCLRGQRGWALSDLACCSGLAKSYLCELEGGLHSPSLEVMLRLEAAFCLAPDDLLRLARGLLAEGEEG